MDHSLRTNLPMWAWLSLPKEKMRVVFVKYKCLFLTANRYIVK